MKCIPPISLYTTQGISMSMPWSIGLDMLTASSVAEPDLAPAAAEVLWVSGTTYAVNDERTSDVPWRRYRRKIAGAGTTRPEADATNWEDIGPSAREVVWVASTAYVEGDVRIRTASHRKFECIAAVSGAVFPELDPDHWEPVGATNRYAMFDIYRNLSTPATTTLTASIAPGQRVSSIGVVGAQCSQFQITMTVGATTYYTRTASMLMRNTRTATDYCFGSFRYNPNFLAFDLPLISGATINITYTGATIRSGRVLVGRAVDMGRVLSGASNDGLNFSKISRDPLFGTSELLAKRTVQKIDVKLLIEKSRVDAMLQLRTDTNAVPCIWSGRDGSTQDGYFKALLNLGPYKQFQIPMDYVNNATINLQTEEI